MVLRNASANACLKKRRVWLHESAQCICLYACVCVVTKSPEAGIGLAVELSQSPLSQGHEKRCGKERDARE